MVKTSAAGVAALAAMAAGALGGQAQAAELVPDDPIICESCGDWNQPQEPFQIFGNTYYVGTTRLSSILIVSDEGLILIDGALSQSAPLIAESIEKLGFKVEDIKLILNTHAHHDHAAGIAALQRASGAEVVASASGAQALAQGGPTPDDPQYASYGMEFPPVESVVRVVADGEVLQLGAVSVTAHMTPGHTPGSTSWTWRTCDGGRCVNVAYADSLAAVSAPGFQFRGADGYPSRVEEFRETISKVAGLPCDVLLSPHTERFRMAAKLERRAAGAELNPFVESHPCAAYAEIAGAALDQRIADEEAAEAAAAAAAAEAAALAAEGEGRREGRRERQ